MRQDEFGDDEILLQHNVGDEVWAEWTAGLLATVGIRVTDSAPRRLIIVSSSDTSPDREAFAVYVTDLRPISGNTAQRSVFVAGLTQREAAERILDLLARSYVEDPPTRYPGVEPTVLKAPARNPRFTGRAESMEALRSQLLQHRTVVVRPSEELQELGGVGKTQLALEYVHRFRAAYDVVWWVESDPPQFVDASLTDLAIRLNVAVGTNAVENSLLVLQALGRGEPTDRWLLVYDNADDVSHVEGLLPRGPGHTLITSRHNGWDDRARPLQIGIFDRAESIVHLRKRLPALTDEDASRVAEAMRDLPIAISAAGAWLAESGMPVTDYLSQIGSGGAAAVVSTWELSLERVAQASPGALRLLQLCSMLSTEIAIDLLNTIARSVDGEVRRLTDLALVKVDAPLGVVHVHRLLQRVVRERMTGQEMLGTRHEVHLALTGARPAGEVDNPDTWPGYRTLWPHLLISGADTCTDERVRQLVIDRIRYLWLRGDLQQAEDLGVRIAADWALQLDDETVHRQWLTLRFHLGNVIRSSGRFQEARDLDEDVLAAQRDRLGPHDADTLRTSGGVAADLRGLGRYAAALEMDKHTHQAWSEVFGDEHPRTMSAANNLAVSHRLMGDFNAARALDEQVYARRRALLGETHPNTQHSASCLGRDLRDAGAYEESVALLRNVYEEICATVGADRVEAFQAQANLAVSLRAAGQAATAMPMLETAYQRLLSMLGAANMATLACRLSRAANLLAVGEAAAADREMQAVIQSYADTYGGEHPDTLICLSNRAAVLRSLDDLSTAADLARHAADRLAEVLSPDHPFTIAARMNLAICLDADQAQTITEAALASLLRLNGPEHPDTLRCQANLALIRADQAAVTDAVDRLAAVVGPEHPTVAAMRLGGLAHRVLDPHPF